MVFVFKITHVRDCATVSPSNTTLPVLWGSCTCSTAAYDCLVYERCLHARVAPAEPPPTLLIPQQTPLEICFARRASPLMRQSAKCCLCLRVSLRRWELCQFAAFCVPEALVQVVWLDVQVNTAPKLVLLDVGMVAELTPEDQRNLVGFFKVSHPLAQTLLYQVFQTPYLRHVAVCLGASSGLPP